MRREILPARALLAGLAVSTAMCVTACSQSASTRAENAAARANREMAVRQTETVERVTIPKDSGRILYDAPTDLSMANALRTKATIVGIDSAAQSPVPAQRSGEPARTGQP